MHLIVTRPKAESDDLADALRAAGHAVTAAPTSAIVAVAGAEVDLSGVTVLAATSRNALRVLATHPTFDQARHLPLYAVGGATAALARSLGFDNVIEGAGRARDLIAPIRAAVGTGGGLLLHLSGEDVAFDLVGALMDCGVAARRAVLYRAEPAEEFPAEALSALRAGTVDGVILMSPAAARRFQDLVRAAGLQAVTQHIVHFCMSDNVAAELQPRSLTIAVARRPSLEELLALVGQVAAKSDGKP